jgi:alkanesulfonate monooxygenase SsuD/methylene tetrahydromethanopterin reductase-like flavin-dependent oxidoreductase (luciferase family)
VDARLELRPIQQPHPPIWIAANNDRAVERAAELGDAWVINPHATLHTIGRQMAYIELPWRVSANLFQRNCR